MKFEVINDGLTLRCQITSDRDLSQPVLCCSLLQPGAVVSGGDLVRAVGGYLEVVLPDLKAGQTHTQS